MFSSVEHLAVCCLLVAYFRAVEMSEMIVERVSGMEFRIYWNVPSFQCRPHKIFFTDLPEKYGIVQNTGDDFWGDEVSILYDPGDFPAILKYNNSDVDFERNGGVPQRGNLSIHLDMFAEVVNDLIPNENFSGIGIIDFESWRPVFRQNFALLEPYKTLSIKIETDKHPTWTKNQILEEAVKNFEQNAREFMEETVYLAKALRPYAHWGYYAYPYCFNMSPNNMNSTCSDQVKLENDKIRWLYEASTAFFPSIYMSFQSQTSQQMIEMITGRILESQRIIRTLNKVPRKPKILPYMWLKYRDNGLYMTKEDLANTIFTLKSLNADGVVIWGSSKDVNSRKNCEMLHFYVNNILGPIISR